MTKEQYIVWWIDSTSDYLRTPAHKANADWWVMFFELNKHCRISHCFSSIWHIHLPKSNDIDSDSYRLVFEDIGAILSLGLRLPFGLAPWEYLTKMGF